MKTLIVLVSGMVLLSLLVPSKSIAEPTHPNEVGLYTNDDGTGATGIYGLNFALEVYFVLTKPKDTQTGTPYSTINAFECQLNFNPIGNIFKLADEFPTQGINFGDAWHIDDGYLKYVVEFNNDFPVIDESVVLIAFLFMHNAPGVIEVTLGPISNPSIPGQMVFQSGTSLEVMHPISGSHEDPVFLFEGEAVAVENEFFGSVKALYR